MSTAVKDAPARGSLLYDPKVRGLVYQAALIAAVALLFYEAATNAIEHAQHPTEPFVDVAAEVGGGRVVITVRDHGQWRERVPSMDRGRGSTLMSAVADIAAVPSPEGTTVTVRAPRSGDTPAA